MIQNTLQLTVGGKKGEGDIDARLQLLTKLWEDPAARDEKQGKDGPTKGGAREEILTISHLPPSLEVLAGEGNIPERQTPGAENGTTLHPYARLYPCVIERRVKDWWYSYNRFCEMHGIEEQRRYSGAAVFQKWKEYQMAEYRRSLASSIVGVIRHLFWERGLRGKIGIEWLSQQHKEDHRRSDFSLTPALEHQLLQAFATFPRLAARDSAPISRWQPLTPPGLRREVVERLMREREELSRSEAKKKEGEKVTLHEVQFGIVRYVYAGMTSRICPICGIVLWKDPKKKGKRMCSQCKFPRESVEDARSALRVREIEGEGIRYNADLAAAIAISNRRLARNALFSNRNGK